MADAAAIRPARPDEVRQVLALWQEADATPSVTDSPGELMKLLGDANWWMPNWTSSVLRLPPRERVPEVAVESA